MVNSLTLPLMIASLFPYTKSMYLFNLLSYCICSDHKIVTVHYVQVCTPVCTSTNDQLPSYTTTPPPPYTATPPPPYTSSSSPPLQPPPAYAATPPPPPPANRHHHHHHHHHHGGQRCQPSWGDADHPHMHQVTLIVLSARILTYRTRHPIVCCL